MAAEYPNIKGTGMGQSLCYYCSMVIVFCVIAMGYSPTPIFKNRITMGFPESLKIFLKKVLTDIMPGIIINYRKTQENKKQGGKTK